jgi:hypothetical protein
MLIAVGSCSAPVWLRWRAKQELSGGDSLDNVHRSAADWTVPEQGSLFGRRLCCRRCVLLYAAEQLEAQRQQGTAVPIGEKSEVANSYKARRQQMDQKAAQELIDRQTHEPLLVAVGGFTPAEGDVVFGERDEPSVGDGDAMGVGAEIAQHMFWSAEGPLGVDHSVVAEQHPQRFSKSARLCQRQQVALELQRTLMEGVA